MRSLIRNSLLGVCLLSILSSVGTASAVPTAVKVRVEGASSTIFSGEVTTDGKDITTAAGGTHSCNGASGVSPNPTTALNDASLANGFTWDADYFGDFFLSRVGSESSTATQFWGLAVNYVPAAVGGCQITLAAGDEAIWAFDFFNADFSTKYFLKITGQSTVEVGEPATVTVTNGETGAPVAGATVGGAETNASGVATVTYSASALQTLKAEKAGAIRSNALTLCVHSSDGVCGNTTATAVEAAAVSSGSSSGSATSSSSVSSTDSSPVAIADTAAPIVTIASAKKKRYSASKAPRTLSGTVLESGGLRTLKLRLTRTAEGKCSWFSGRTRVFRKKRCGSNEAPFSIVASENWSYLLPKQLAKGKYTLEVLATDKSWNRKNEQVEFSVR